MSQAPAKMKETERVVSTAPMPGRGPMGGGMVGQKAMTFGPSAKRLLRRMAPERFKARPGARRREERGAYQWQV